ncbi:hypothetical protein M0813_16262 [Anaeramoeba flamelloides]|uniref:DUF4185 domain-containing protein n=1 Tax=Anaeramoeba flamelloides TaxID=1746091 RepID=A0ABQ8Z021_9EUKA|nr:hypothetical protein M0813_16262 [Anaeramoeba flamelloides]
MFYQKTNRFIFLLISIVTIILVTLLIIVSVTSGNTEAKILEKKVIKIEKATEFSQNCYYDPKQKWLSADVDVYIPLFRDTEQNGIWLFGDTIIGDIDNQTNKKVLQGFLRNSVGVVKGDPLSGKSSSTYYWTHHPNISNAKSFFLHPKEPDYWYWAINGISFTNENNTDSTLILFVLEMKFENDQPMGLNFEVNKCLTFKFESSKQDLLLNLQNPQFTIAEIPRQNSTNWISSIVYNDTEKNLYLIGSKPNNKTNHAVLSRISKENLLKEDWSHVEYLFENNTFLHSSDKVIPNLKLLFRNIPQESVFYYMPKFDKWVVLMGEFFTANVYMRVSDNLTGEWSNQISIFTVPAPYDDLNKYLLTTIKIQKHFITQENKIIFTYIINAGNWPELLKIGVYVPIWMRIEFNENYF